MGDNWYKVVNLSEISVFKMSGGIKKERERRKKLEKELAKQKAINDTIKREKAENEKQYETELQKQKDELQKIERERAEEREKHKQELQEKEKELAKQKTINERMEQELQKQE